MTLLVLGRNGQVGWHLVSALAPLGPVTALDQPEVDFTDPDGLRRVVREVQPALIVNAAAYTAVDRAESEPDVAMAVNAAAPAVLAEEAARLGVPLVHYSTDYVYDGTKDGPYTEADGPNPASVYGRSKLAGDEAVQAAGCAHLILRTSWVYSAHGHCFPRTMLRLMHEREELRVVDDQVGAPTWSLMIAQATAAILAQWAAPRGGLTLRDVSGVYHLTAGGSTSWHGFAQAVAELDPRRESQTLRRLVPIPSSEYPTPAPRPANSRLDTTRLRETFGLTLPPWRTSLERLFAEQTIPGLP